MTKIKELWEKQRDLEWLTWIQQKRFDYKNEKLDQYVIDQLESLEDFTWDCKCSTCCSNRPTETETRHAVFFQEMRKRFKDGEMTDDQLLICEGLDLKYVDPLCCKNSDDKKNKGE